MSTTVDIHSISLNKAGEELCGDQVRVHRTPTRTRIVLSDGLGSGVKANILATLTSEILITMLRDDVPLDDVIETIVGTLPTCQVRKIAYATFTIIEIDHQSNQFQVINFDNPPPFFLRHGRVQPLETTHESIQGKEITFSQGQLQQGDFLATISDGVWYAGLGNSYNFGWGWENIANYMTKLFGQNYYSAQTVVERVMAETERLYAGLPGDDATFVGALVRRRREALVFTGPPRNPDDDERIARRVIDFDGRRIVCGGTTGNIVARVLDDEIETLTYTMTKDIPPRGRLPGIHLLTEGILTLSRALELIENSGGDSINLPAGKDSGIVLALELLLADEITFLVGQQINAYYQNPSLPAGISIRTTLVEKLAQALRQAGKQVTLEYC